jgi:hypothetical protein
MPGSKKLPAMPPSVLSKPIKTPQYSLDAAGSIFLSGSIFPQMLAFASAYRKMLWQLTRRGTGDSSPLAASFDDFPLR